jgi:hypothetical protein
MWHSSKVVNSLVFDNFFSRSHVLRGNAVWTLCVLPLENNHKQIRKNLIEKMEIITFFLYLQGDAKRLKCIPTQSMGTRITEKFTGRIFTKKITNL